MSGKCVKHDGHKGVFYQCGGCEEEIQSLCASLATEREKSGALAVRMREFRNAVGALTHPDDVIRGPLLDGPELDELNRVYSLPDNVSEVLRERDEEIFKKIEKFAASKLLEKSSIPKDIGFNAGVSIVAEYCEAESARRGE